MKSKSVKFAAIILAIALCLSTTAYAAKPVSDAGASYVPLREVCNTLGIGVSWDNATRTISLDDYGKALKLTLNGATTLTNTADGTSMPAKLVNNKTFVPQDLLGKLLGATFQWNAATQSYEVVSWGSIPQPKSSITIASAQVTGDKLVVKGTTAIDTSKSTYIQYYIGKDYDGTVPVCIYSAGCNAYKDGSFELNVPVANLKGYGDYEIVLEQNPASDSIIAPSHWTGFTKDTAGNVTFGDITSMDEISNLALTVGMQIAGSTFTYGAAAPANNAITITSTTVSGDNVVVAGKTTIDTSKSTYIQYYIGKVYDGTLSECIACAGFNANKDGTFTLTLPVSSLKGNGDYELVLEQNPASDKILAPSHWIAFTKDAAGAVTFGDITSMGEISNLALAVGMQTAATGFTVGTAAAADQPITITSAENKGGDIVIKGTTTIDTGKSKYIQYYVGKEYANTLSNCVVCAGFNVNADGTFELTIPNSALKGNGVYTVVLEQNPASDKILAPENWKAFYKDADGKVIFGSISAMKEISNLALTVGMKTAETTVIVAK